MRLPPQALSCAEQTERLRLADAERSQQETKLILAHARVNYYRRLLKVATVREEAAAAARVQLAAPPGLQQPIEVAKKKRSICPLNKCRACFNEDRNKRPSVAHTRGENGTVCRLNPRRHSHV